MKVKKPRKVEARERAEDDIRDKARRAWVVGADVGIDPDARVIQVGNGYWVAAWVWIGSEKEVE